MKKVLITGASEGIGRALARKFAFSGFEVTAIARNEDRLLDLINEIGKEHHYLVVDLTKENDLKKVIHLIRHTHFDVLINNAGFGIYGAFTTIPLEKHLELLDLNCKTLLTLSHIFLSNSKPGDALVNISSVVSFASWPYSPVYAASKAFVTSLTESLWYEFRSKGVYVLTLCPGATNTKFHSRAGGKKDTQLTWTQNPEDVAETVWAALIKRKDPTVISGWFNKVFIFSLRFLPRKLTIVLMDRISK